MFVLRYVLAKSKYSAHDNYLFVPFNEVRKAIEFSGNEYLLVGKKDGEVEWFVKEWNENGKEKFLYKLFEYCKEIDASIDELDDLLIVRWNEELIYVPSFVRDEDIENILNTLGYNISVSIADEYEDLRENVAVFFVENREMSAPSLLTDLPYVDVYEFWDGRNQETMVLDILYDVTISDNCVCLDEWDGSNHYTVEKFHHQYVYKVLELNGETCDDVYVVEYRSQWQGNHPTADIFFSKEELVAHLEDVNRDPREYIPKIEKLG